MSQQERIVLQLRELILNGGLAPGERVLEVALAETLQASRTPVRRAIKILEGEGLLVSNGARGYQVRQFSFRDVVNAIEVRGVLEGLAAQAAARRGLSPEAFARLEECIEIGRALAGKSAMTAGDEEVFANMNLTFHDTVIDAACNRSLKHALAFNDRLPFAAAGAVAINVSADAREAQMALLVSAQRDHVMIHHALRQRQGARAGALVREHAYVAVEHMRLVLAARGVEDDADAGSDAISRFDGCGN